MSETRVTNPAFTRELRRAQADRVRIMTGQFEKAVTQKVISVARKFNNNVSSGELPLFSSDEITIYATLIKYEDPDSVTVKSDKVPQIDIGFSTRFAIPGTFEHQNEVIGEVSYFNSAGVVFNPVSSGIAHPGSLLDQEALRESRFELPIDLPQDMQLLCACFERLESIVSGQGFKN